MNACRHLVLIGFSVLLAREAEAQQCDPGETEVGRKQIGNELHLWCVADSDVAEYRKNETRLVEIPQREAELTSQIAGLDSKLASERKTLEKLMIDLGKIQMDSEAWVELTAEARQASNEAALNALATVLLARVDAIGKQKNALAKQELDELYNEYQSSILSTLATRNAKEAGIVAPAHQWRNMQEFLADLKKLTTLTSSAHAASKGDNWRALAKLASIALKDQRAKMLVADVDFMIAAVYKNRASWTANERVEQLLALSDDGLKGVKSFANVYRTHVAERKTLRLERDALPAEKQKLEERQIALRGS